MSELNDSFSNPLAPPGHVVQDSGKHLTNEDFRKLVMTVGRDPNATSSVVAATAAKEKRAADPEKKKKKKQQYLKFKRDKEEREKELIAKYRDRARERRDGVNQDYEDVELLQATADYRAVAPDAKRQEELKERRKKAIDESKYLGGDMQHTHLVKGLDYALLDKVRQEITTKKRQDDVVEQEHKQYQKKDDEEINTINSVGARNIVRTVFGTNGNNAASLRDLFASQRMAYVVELEDDPNAETDIPTTVLRSVAESGYSGGGGSNGSGGPSSSEMVVEKLTEILAYLRSGKGKSRIVRKGDTAPAAPLSAQAKSFSSRSYTKASATSADKIFDEVGDYVPAVKSTKFDASNFHKRGSYFGKSETREQNVEKPQSVGDVMKGFQSEAMSFDTETGSGETNEKTTASGSRIRKKLEQKLAVDSYAECYPGMMESMDTLADSDEEADLTKMDMGTRKGPLNRWDFETAEEFETYKSSQEALPKAAFQYGVKMTEGRKTRRVNDKKDDKVAIEREWKKIQQIWDRKRDSGAGDDRGGDNEDDASKRPRQ